jgi:hypothetical protein
MVKLILEIMEYRIKENDFNDLLALKLGTSVTLSSITQLIVEIVKNKDNSVILTINNKDVKRIHYNEREDSFISENIT